MHYHDFRYRNRQLIDQVLSQSCKVCAFGSHMTLKEPRVSESFTAIGMEGEGGGGGGGFNPLFEVE